jgi:hypothetical protein
MSDVPRQPMPPDLDYLRQMLLELRDLAEIRRYAMLAYLIEMAFIEASEMLGGRRPLRIDDDQGDGSAGVPFKPPGEV